ncbi:hypothetical protein EXN66_Car016974 [Channa argus]|uniref:Uncharacterized protein n=1 Tax=Channa argus TaxID=215402 RepID=A0A6G1QGQ7_CHAAH|nr:hypothetical protein EXN66_Car016974 [Channa argus]
MCMLGHLELSSDACLPPGRCLSSIYAGTAIKRWEVSKMVREDAGHLAPFFVGWFLSQA